MILKVSPFIEEILPAVYATVAGFFIGILVKVVDRVLDKRKNTLEEHLALRKELREELEAVKQEVYTLHDANRNIMSELDEWKEKYYTQLQITQELRLDVLRLTEELEEYKRITGQFPTESVDNN